MSPFLATKTKHRFVKIRPSDCFTMTPMDPGPAVGASPKRSFSRRKGLFFLVQFPSSHRSSQRIVRDFAWTTRLGFRLVLVIFAISVVGACNRQSHISRHLDFNQD